MKKRISILLLLIIFLQTISPTIPGLTKSVEADSMVGKAAESFINREGHLIKYQNVIYQIKTVSKQGIFDAKDGKVYAVGYYGEVSEITIESFLNDINYGGWNFDYWDYVVAGVGAYDSNINDNGWKSIESIGGSIFKGSTTLKEVTIKSGKDGEDRLRNSWVGKNVFENCTELKEVNVYTQKTFEDCFHHFDDYAFKGCNKLTTIKYPSSIKCLHRGTFEGTAITDFTITDDMVSENGTAEKEGNVDGMNQIPKDFFKDCGELNNVTVNATKLYKICESAFQGCKKLQQLFLKNLNKINNIEKNAFNGCESLKNINTIKTVQQANLSNVTRIGEYAFNNCGLEYVLLNSKNLEELPNNCFSNCKFLKKIRLGDNITKIGKQCFMGCDLREFSWNTKLEEIGVQAFSNCSGLKQIDMPESVIRIGYNAFEYCTNLEKIDFSSSKLEKCFNDGTENSDYFNFNLFKGVNNVDLTVDSVECTAKKKLENPRRGTEGEASLYNFKFIYNTEPTVNVKVTWNEEKSEVTMKANDTSNSGILEKYYIGLKNQPNENLFQKIVSDSSSNFEKTIPISIGKDGYNEDEIIYGFVQYNNGQARKYDSCEIKVGKVSIDDKKTENCTYNDYTGTKVSLKGKAPTGKSDDDLKYYYSTNGFKYEKWFEMNKKDSEGFVYEEFWGSDSNGEYRFKVVLDGADVNDKENCDVWDVTLSNGKDPVTSSGGSEGSGEDENSGGETTKLSDEQINQTLDYAIIKRYGEDGLEKSLTDSNVIKPRVEKLWFNITSSDARFRINGGTWQDASVAQFIIQQDINSLEICIQGYEHIKKSIPINIKLDHVSPTVKYSINYDEGHSFATVQIAVQDVGVGFNGRNCWLKDKDGSFLITGALSEEGIRTKGKEYEINIDKQSSNKSIITMKVRRNESFTLYVADAADNTTESRIIIDKIDEKDPEITNVDCVKYSEATEWIFAPEGVTITVTANDWNGEEYSVEGLKCSFDNGSSWDEGVNGVFSKVFEEKNENIQIIVKDKAGHETKCGETFYIPNIDKTLPEIQVLEVIKDNEGEDGWTRGAKLRVEVKDQESGINRDRSIVCWQGYNVMNVSIGELIEGEEDIYEINIFGEGENYCVIHAYNNAGAGIDYKYDELADIKIDTTPPEIKEIDLNTESVSNESVTLTIYADDPKETYSGADLSGLAENPYSFDGGETWVNTPSKTFSENQEVSIVVKDKAGNTTYEAVEIENIRKFDELEITSNPNIMTYVDGQNFDPTGMVITAKYTAGEDVVLTEDDYTIIYEVEGKTEGHENGKDLVAGVNTITIEYEDEGFDNVKTKRTIDLEITVEELALSNISVQTMPTKTEYYEGQDFDPTGMKIVAFYNNQFATINAQDYEIVDGENLKYNQTTVTIKYTDTTVDGTEITSTTTVPITVIEKELTKIEIKTPPDRTVYVEGESFDKRGMVVEATFNDGSTKTLTDSEYTISSSNAYNMSKGTKDITISYTYRGSSKTQTKYTTQQVTVQKKKLTSIAIKKYATKTSYISSEDFNPAGMEIIAWYNDMLAEKIANDDMGFENINYDEVIKTNQTYVRISYTYDGVTKTVDHPITVRERKLVSIRVDTPPDKTYYIEGQNFVKDGMVIKAKYDSNKEEEITNYTITNGTVLAVGQRSVTISYTEDGITRTTTQPISVEELELTSLQIVQGPDKTTYVEGQDFDTTGMLVRVWYNNCIVQTISDYVLEGNTNLTLGTNKVTVKYTEDGIEVSATVTINVVKKELSGIKITREPDKIKYIEGQNFDTTGMIVEAVYNDDTTKVITEYTVRDGNNLAAGKELVTILYTENGKTVSTTQRISVDEKVITKLEIKQQPTKTKYIEGQNFVKDGMVVIVTYNDGETKEINNYTVVNGKNLTPGNIDIEIKYTEDNITLREYQRIEVEAKILTSIEVTTPPNKTQYVEGQNFVADGMVIKANFNDGSSQNVTDYEILDGDYLSAGRKIITIRYVKDSEVATTTQDIEVVKKVITRLVITTPPDKVNYLEGEDFEKNGMVITAQYNDGETKEITSYTITNGKKLTLEQTSVTISYTEDRITNTVEQNITVKEKLVVNIDTYEEIKDNEKSYLENIMPNTTIAELLEKINTNGDVTIYKNGEIVTNQEENIGTGMEIVITLNDETIRYTVVVTGDLNGDGQMGDADVLIMARYMVSLEENINEASLRAADVMRDGHYATDTDLLKMVRILVGLSTL